MLFSNRAVTRRGESKQAPQVHARVRLGESVLLVLQEETVLCAMSVLHIATNVQRRTFDSSSHHLADSQTTRYQCRVSNVRAILGIHESSQRNSSNVRWKTFVVLMYGYTIRSNIISLVILNMVWIKILRFVVVQKSNGFFKIHSGKNSDIVILRVIYNFLTNVCTDCFQDVLD